MEKQAVIAPRLSADILARFLSFFGGNKATKERPVQERDEKYHFAPTDAKLCKECGRCYWPKEGKCPDCGSVEAEIFSVMVFQSK